MQGRRRRTGPEEPAVYAKTHARAKAFGAAAQ